MLELLTLNAIWLLFALALCVYLYSKLPDSNLPPGPKGLPLVGYVPFLGKHPASTIYKLSKKYGPIISIKLGTKCVVVFNDYDVVQEALVKRGDVFSGRPKLHIIEKISQGYGIIFRNYDEVYKSQRKFALTTMREFGLGKRSMEDRISEEIEYFVELLASQNGESFDFQDALYTSVSNVICSVSMGSRFSYDDEIFRKLVNNLHKSSSGEDSLYVNLMIFAPALRFLPLFSGVYKRMLASNDNNAGFIRDKVEEHKRTLDFKNPRDFIDVFLIEMQRKGQGDASFNEHQLLETVRDFFGAGSETSASTLEWFILVLAHQQNIQEKLYQEIKEIIGDAVPAMKFKEKMPYTAAFLHEISRHRTLAPLGFPHATTQDVTFRGYYIPRNTTIMPNIWGVHHDPDVFENPNEFRPERFLNENGRFVPHQHVIPFSVGPRYCLGEQLAKMELFLFLTNIVRQFHIVADPKKPLPDFNDSISGIAEGPLPYAVLFKPRN